MAKHKRTKAAKPKATAAKAAWTIEEHAKACSCSRRFYYSLPLEKRPRSVHMGARKVLIVESPEAYMQRMAGTAPQPAQPAQ